MLSETCRCIRFKGSVSDYVADSQRHDHNPARMEIPDFTHSDAREMLLVIIDIGIPMMKMLKRNIYNKILMAS